MSIIITFLFGLGLIGLWLIDIAVIATSPILTSGFWEIERVKVYHIGLYLTLVVLAILTLLAVARGRPIKR